MANNKQSWLDGPNIPGENDDPSAPGRWPGEKLGLPQTGAGALASVMRRVGGITFDWFICRFAATIVHRFTDQLGGVSTINFIVFLILGTLSVTFLARTPGQAVLGMGVARIDVPEARVGFIRAFVRSLLTLFIFPAVIVDSDGRGLHDRATGTAVVFG
mgnify:FL=1